MEGADPDAHRYELEAYDIRTFVPEPVVGSAYDGRALLRILARKLAGKLSGGRFGEPASARVAAVHAGLQVFDRPEHHMGGLAFGLDYPRVLNELGVGRAERMHELCAGPGYIGYALLAAGWCDELVLSDINPEPLSCARLTAAENGVAHRVSIYESDALDDIPAGERWDLVVANPPHFLPGPGTPEDIRVHDPGWSLHQRIYGSLGRHIEPGGLAVLSGNERGSDPRRFEEMVVAGGGRVRAIHPGRDLRGRPNGLYYLLSEW
ncbi:MAG: methyltransferase [Solirubrobacterales bacterium]|nr:methyltransferase [Solirubrobacterales bacterium]